eukprot:Skav214003  [mRNA]  locus=scaffold1070:168210:171205:- [translate_table: standard]
MGVGAWQSEEITGDGRPRLPPEDDAVVALPASQAVHLGPLWPPQEELQDDRIGSKASTPTMKIGLERQVELQHQKVMHTLEGHEQLLRKVLIGVRSLGLSPSPMGGVPSAPRKLRRW